MRALIFLSVLLIVCAGCWRVATALSPDAVGMAVGMLFGVLAGIPTALLMKAGGNRHRDDEEEDYRGAAYPYQAPVVIIYPQHHDALPTAGAGYPPLPDGQRTLAPARRGALPPLPPLPSGYRPDPVIVDYEREEW